ncbi:uncharacterized protein N7529_003421 [Penicillium soppii]|uniref:uncharacterized protein n=1 Tax=Penicillium soppii TaxID=69789 RepID=UPI0025474D8C|nr:uncharacterized protein N7529_003421 [Penicillium soppii]KAJ5874991.1 hypothetical protein N7529_003421 [Penicillium soppii]
MSIIFNALPLPPIPEFGEPFYRSAEQAIEAINMHAQPQGFAVSKRGSQPKRVRIQCARSRAYKAQKTTNHQSTTRSTECPYRATLHLRSDPDITSNHGLWDIQIVESGHNHDRQPGHTFAIHQTRQIDRFRIQVIAGIHQGSSPSMISQGIKNQCEAIGEEFTLNPDRIGRFIFDYRQSDLGGYSQIQNLLKQDNDQWIIHYDVDTDDQLTAAFLVHRSSIELLRSNPFFLWMDCTYKTNRYHFPLLDIIGESSVGATLAKRAIGSAADPVPKDNYDR